MALLVRLSLILALVSAVPAWAQDRVPADSLAVPPADSLAAPSLADADADLLNADVALWARVSADEVRFGTVPQVRVSFPGHPEQRTLFQTLLSNLPESVVPDIVYRDVGVELVILTTLAELQAALRDVSPDGAPAGRRP